RGEALVFDTPADAAASEALLQWIREKAKCKIKAVVPTHFHVDCLGTLNIFHREGIPSYAYGPTVHLAKAREFFVPQHEFSDRTEMSVGAVKVEIWHPGAGHTSDNVVAYVPVDKTLFGGCLVKSVGAGKGNLNDADVAAWPTTAAALRNRYPELQTVVPGHGKWGGVELLAFTEKLFAE
ncbi:MAG: subclass B1 metallo-beta-lactamase, partial [Bacteroidota bacterium]